MTHALTRPSYQNQERIISCVAQCMLTSFGFKRKQDELSVSLRGRRKKGRGRGEGEREKGRERLL